MPELPEVETVVRGLAAHIIGSRIAGIELKRKDLRIPFPKDFAKSVAGVRITAISRRAKYLIFTLDNKMSIIAHMGMSGSFSVSKPRKAITHDHVIFTLDDGRTLIYNDPRRFGVMTLCKTAELEKHPLLVVLGPEPFSKEFNASYLQAQLARRKGAIKPVLMDQKLVVGVGNIYASEALFLAGIDPCKPASAAVSKASLLIKCIRKVLADAIESGGSTLRNFANASGEAGYFQHKFNVYDREGEPCFICGKEIIAIRQAGRSTFYCKHCQR